jgi:hypothetical protein
VISTKSEIPMPRTVLQVVHTHGTPAEIAVGILALNSRPEVLNHGASVHDGRGYPVDTLVLTGDPAHDGGANYIIHIASPDDPIAAAVEGDTV